MLRVTYNILLLRVIVKRFFRIFPPYLWNF
nr:MAG TPA: OpgC protein [Caudoviricetes sp.]